MNDDDFNEVIDMVQKIRPHLRGHAPEIQGAVLAYLTANWLTGHCIPGDPTRTAELREQLLFGLRPSISAYFDRGRTPQKMGADKWLTHTSSTQTLPTIAASGSARAQFAAWNARKNMSSVCSSITESERGPTHAVNWLQADIRRKVLYAERMPSATTASRLTQFEEGVITSINAQFVFVNYGHTSWGIATLREELEWSGA